MNWETVVQPVTETDVLGDIDEWVEQYLDSGLHVQEWDARLQVQRILYAQWLQALPGHMPPSGRAAEEGAA